MDMKQPGIIQKPSLSFVCSEELSKMKPCEQGRFCGSCKKTVVDFTQKSDTEIFQYVTVQKEKICGTFYPHQLAHPVSNSISFRRILSIFMVVLGFGCENKQTYSIESQLTGEIIEPIPPLETHKENSEFRQTPNPDSLGIYSISEVMPVYKKGGEAGLVKFIAENTKALKSQVKGLVVCSIVVRTDGRVSEPKILKSLSTEADSEALRVVQLLDFYPGKQNAENVPVRMPLIVRFN